MIQHPELILLFLLAIETGVLWISSRPSCQKYFNFLPPVFWIYFLPMLASTLGVIDSKSAVYPYLTNYLLPVSLFILLISVDLKAILKLGRPALIMMAAGSFGIVFGAPIIFFLFKPWIGSAMWAGFGAICGSWTGGSANLIAVKEALGAPDSVFLPMVIVDTIVPYVWMGILVALVSKQDLFDRWNRSERGILDELKQKKDQVAIKAGKLEWGWAAAILLLGIAGGFIAIQIGGWLPVIKDTISNYAWTILTVTALGLIGSLTPLRSVGEKGSNTIGYFLLYLVLTSIGAKANLSSIGQTGVLIGAGFCLVAVHAVVLLIAARIIRAPLFLVVAASQANIGGVASAPVVAEIYQPGLASVGLLLAILGNIVGTYLGILAGQLCRIVAY